MLTKFCILSLLLLVPLPVTTARPHDSFALETSTHPWETSLAQLWQDRGEWLNGTQDSLRARALTPPNGAGQFVSYKRLGDSARYSHIGSGRFVISLAVVVWDASSKLCEIASALLIDSNDRVANAIANNGWDILSDGSLWSDSRLSTDVFHSSTVNTATTVIVRFTVDAFFDTDVFWAASSLALRWNLGTVVKDFLPTRPGERRGLQEVASMGVISEGKSWTRDEVEQLHTILDSLPKLEASEPSSQSGRATKRASCDNIGLQQCRVGDRSVWNTEFTAGC